MFQTALANGIRIPFIPLLRLLRGQSGLNSSPVLLLISLELLQCFCSITQGDSTSIMKGHFIIYFTGGGGPGFIDSLGAWKIYGSYSFLDIFIADYCRPVNPSFYISMDSLEGFAVSPRVTIPRINILILRMYVEKSQKRR